MVPYDLLEEQAVEKEYFEWTPVLSCHNASEAPAVNYIHQKGYGVKIKINENLSIVFVSAYFRGSIESVSSRKQLCLYCRAALF